MSGRNHARRPSPVDLGAEAADLEDIKPWRDMYRLEMACQIIHDSIHERRGWTREYILHTGGTTVGYGSVAVAGPWAGKPTAYEFYVAANERQRVFDWFSAFLRASGAAFIEVQTNDALASAMLFAYAEDVKSEAILFRDASVTSHQPRGAVFREPSSSEMPDVLEGQLPWHGVVEVDGHVAATGGILFHYNPPYGDVYMQVAKGFRRRGFGSFLVQELKRICYAGGRIPGARCSPANTASRRTLQKAGFVPCGHLLTGRVSDDAETTRV